AEIGRDLPETCGLLLYAGGTAVEVRAQEGACRQRQFRIGIDGLDLEGVEQFDAGHRYSRLDGRNGRLACRLDRGKRANTTPDRFRNAVKSEGDFRNDRERALGADQQPGEIVTRCRLAGTARRRDRLAVGE